MGNIDKRALAQGKEAIKGEVDRKVPYLKDDGGFVPGVDHVVPSDVPLESFTFYADYMKNSVKY
jgi:uroporphyrinogen decarboxylase